MRGGGTILGRFLMSSGTAPSGSSLAVGEYGWVEAAALPWPPFILRFRYHAEVASEITRWVSGLQRHGYVIKRTTVLVGGVVQTHPRFRCDAPLWQILAGKPRRIHRFWLANPARILIGSSFRANPGLVSSSSPSAYPHSRAVRLITYPCATIQVRGCA